MDGYSILRSDQIKDAMRCEANQRESALMIVMSRIIPPRQGM